MGLGKKQKKALVFVSAGLGDALLLLPLAKVLKAQGYSVSAWVNSPFPNEQLFEGSGVFDTVVTVRGKIRSTFTALFSVKKYDLVLLNYFASTRTNRVLAAILGRQIHTNRLPDHLKNTTGGLFRYFPPRPGIHDAVQNMLLAGQGDVPFTEDLMQLPCKTELRSDLPASFFVLQISAGNNIHAYKNWPVEHWISFLKRAAATHPAWIFVVLGDIHEKILADTLLAAKTGNVISLAGQTDLRQALAVINQSKLFIGLDGGLLHAAVALGKPSFSLWGPSNPVLYGYAALNPVKHKVLSLHLACSPCSAWINPNTSRVLHPDACPDRKCLTALLPDGVFAEFTTFVKSNEPV
jgi:ADP-heptose:LPS heptosyltransferase